VHTFALHVAVGASQYWLDEHFVYEVLDSPLALQVRTSPSWQKRVPGVQMMAMQVPFAQT
jgi:hypothetical protein